MPKKTPIHTNNAWVTGKLCLAGALDNRMLEMLQAIEQTGSINQAAKQLGLSYKGAWQIIERANNGAPKTLVTTATGGSKGGGTCLTEAGHALLALFTDLERQHQEFLERLNRNIAKNSDTLLLLQRLAVKTSIRNQLFGKIVNIVPGEVSAEIFVELKGGAPIVATIAMASLNKIGLKTGFDALLLINGADIALTAEDSYRFTARNRMPCKIMRVQQDAVNSEILMLLPGGEMLTAIITQQSIQDLALEPGMPVIAIFKSNAVIVGAIQNC